MAPADGNGPNGEDEHPLDLTPADESAASAASEPDGAWSDEPLETARLAFGDDEVRLPWLETDGEDDDDVGGYNPGQVTALIVLGLIALGLIGGGIWWAVHSRGSQAVVADGSVIAAPTQPYKERPKDPGGKTFAGTGDTSFAVSEGQTRPAKLGDAGAPAPASPAASPTPAAKPSSAAAKPAATPASAEPAGVGVQVAAYSNRAQAEAGWTRLSGQYEALSGVRHRVVEGQADIGTVYRLQAVPGDAAAAHALCGQLKAAGLACQVKN